MTMKPRKPMTMRSYTVGTGKGRTPPRCPSCHEQLDAATCIDEEPGAPAAGSPTLCAYCLVFLRFVSRHTLRVLTSAEWEALAPEQRALLTKARDYLRAQNAVRESRGARGGGGGH